MLDVTEVAFDFNREDDGMVWVRLDLGFNVTLTLRSDEPSGCREWVADEMEIGFDGKIVDTPLQRSIDVPYESDLGRALTKAFDEFVTNEDRFLRSHYLGGKR